MTLRLRNTLTRSVEPVLPLDGATVRMYTCGPTVYRYAHVGNLRTFLLADFIRRALLYHGLGVLHVQNITDVGHMRDERFDRGEDRMLVAAGLENKTPAEIADAYEAAFHADEAAVNILPAHVFPRATEHIPEMVELAERLVDAGFAYESPLGNVYYSVESFPDYGRLSGNTVDDLRAGHRGEVEPDKRDPADFALWKSAGEGRLLKWPTDRWGEGFPGWHLECSAMAMRHLGPRFDIHTGGIDNVFPHHEGEIAQSAPIVGGPPARLWVHGEFLQVGGQKMAKSAGNIERVTELADRGIDPLAFRYLALTSRYRHKLEYTDESIGAAAAGLESLRNRLRVLGPPPPDGPWAAPPVLDAAPAGDRPSGTADGVAGHGTTPDAAAWTPSDRAHAPPAPLSPAGRDLHDRFSAAVDDDLDLPTALAVVREALGNRDLAADERRWLTLDADLVLGLGLDRAWTAEDAPVPDEIARLARERDEARARRDFATADRIRDDLTDRGWQVVDGPDGSRVTRRA
ncbi:MAG TPA: cysteine--tRNA ligase [Candidatus Limnocylindrales bacterium]|nr:cysteine--tRNA ligase [Candidatus Limnocylindrales bacterium]